MACEASVTDSQTSSVIKTDSNDAPLQIGVPDWNKVKKVLLPDGQGGAFIIS